MRGHLLVLVCVWATSSALAASSSSSSSLAWRRFKREHQKVYGPEEDAMRFANFLETKQMVERHNANPNNSFKMGLNHMADWTREEREQLTGTKNTETPALPRGGSLSPELAKLLDGPVPKEVDWRKVPNRVSAVKEQGSCYSDWAFTAAGLLEGQEAAHNISGFIPLSAQQLIDCSTTNSGCIEGYAYWAIDDMRDQGIESEADYPYEGETKGCRVDKSKYVMPAVKGASILNGGERELMKAVANYGPVAVRIWATKNFIFYRSGIFYDDLCNPNDNSSNRDLLVVGYGTDEKDGNYWIIKNSWGTKWGEEGYIKMKRGINICGISVHMLVATF